MINACALTMKKQQQSSLSGRAGKRFCQEDGKEARKERAEAFIWHTHAALLPKVAAILITVDGKARL